MDVALASGSTVKAVVSGALQSHATRGAVDLWTRIRYRKKEDTERCELEVIKPMARRSSGTLR